MLQVWKDRTCVNDKYGPLRNCKQREERQEYEHGNEEALCCCPVQLIHKGRRQGRPVPHLLLSSDENCKMVKKGGTYLLNCVLFNALFVYRMLNTNKVKYKNFLHELGRF